MPSCLSKSVDEECSGLTHPWCDSCVETFITIFTSCTKYSFKIYTVLYALSFLIMRRDTHYLKSKLLREVLQSTLFLGCNGGLYAFYSCLIRNILGRFYSWSVGFLPGLLASFCAILLEQKKRRKVLAFYMLNQAYDPMFNMLKDFSYVKNVPYGDVFVFSLSMAPLMHMYSSGVLPDGIVKTILDKCFKDTRKNGIAEETTADHNHHKILKTGDDSNMNIAKKSVFLGLKVFTVSSSLHMLYSILTSLPKLFDKPGVMLPKLIARKDKFYFGAWLGSFAGLYTSFSKILQKFNGRGGHRNNALAGGVAGLSMLWFRDTSYALYIFTKVLELLYMHGIDKGMVPYVKNFEVLLYSICTALMFHVAVLQPLYLKPTYYAFLNNLTDGKFGMTKREKLEPLGYNSMRLYQLPRPNAYVRE